MTQGQWEERGAGGAGRASSKSQARHLTAKRCRISRTVSPCRVPKAGTGIQEGNTQQAHDSVGIWVIWETGEAQKLFNCLSQHVFLRGEGTPGPAEHWSPASLSSAVDEACEDRRS